MSKNYVGKKIEIIKCWACNPNYANCTPKSVHKIVNPPHNCRNSKWGVWIRGENIHKIYIQKDEFKFYKRTVARKV